MNDNSKAIALAKKLQALANRGVGGEADNARKLLDNLLKQHNITLEDIEKPERHWCEYDIMVKHQRLFWAIVFNVIQNFDGHYRSVRHHKRLIRLELTYAEQLEITAKFDHYVRYYDKQLNMFMDAFIYKHELYPNRTPEFERAHNGDGKGLTNDELSTMFNLAKGIKRNDYQQRVEDMSKLLTD
jgi:hypothetical protein